MATMASKMSACLIAALAPTALDIVDDSDDHSGHAGHSGAGESHFTIRIESAEFAGQSRVARQRRVYAALGPLIGPGGIHAVVIDARAPGEG